MGIFKKESMEERQAREQQEREIKEQTNNEIEQYRSEYSKNIRIYNELKNKWRVGS